jgi:hypothetical protein
MLPATVAHWIRGRALRRMPREVFYAVLFGPAQEFTRSWLAGRSKTLITTAERALGGAAWRALRREGDDEDG